MAEVKDNPIINYAVATAQQEARSTQTAVDMHKAMDDQQDAYNAAEIATLSLGSAEQTIVSEKNAFAAASDARITAIRNEFGADPTQVGAASNTWLARMQDAAEKQYQALDVIKEKQSKTLLSDPLGFINAQFTLPADIATHNYYDSQRSIAEEQLNEITSASNANVIAARNAQQTTSTELAIAEGTKAAQAAQLGVAKLVLEAAGSRKQGLAEINQLGQQQLSNVFAAHSAMNSDQSLEMQRQAHLDMEADRKLRLEAIVEGKADKEANAADQEAMRVAYNAAAKRLNKPTIDDSISWKRYFAVQLKNPEFQDMLGQGQDIMLAGGVTNGIAVSGSAGKTALLVTSGSTNGLKLDPVNSFLADRLGEVKQNPSAPKDREGLAAMVTDHATTVAKSQLAQIRSEAPNIYAAPPVSVVLQAVGLADGPFINSVVRPLVEKDPSIKIPDDVLVAKAVDFASTRGNINAAAQDLSTYYQIAALKNTITNQYVEKGLPKQTTYNAVIDGKVINLADPLAVKTYLIRKNTSFDIQQSGAFATMLGN